MVIDGRRETSNELNAVENINGIPQNFLKP